MPTHLDACPYCSETQVTVRHVLLECYVTQPLRDTLHRVIAMPSPRSSDAYIRELFRSDTPACFREHHVEFVGKAILNAILPLVSQGCTFAEVEDDLQLTSAASIDALLRYAQESVGARVEHADASL